VEKRLPHYSLDSIKATLKDVASLRMTRTSQNNAFDLGLSLDDVVALIQGITRELFYKSMTSGSDHRIWQDVYHVPHGDLTLYVKFTTDDEGYFVISFKEK
jgi:motility quorum-sensing regulator/GCU-specific mRNA interferase toxin